MAEYEAKNSKSNSQVISPFLHGRRYPTESNQDFTVNSGFRMRNRRAPVSPMEEILGLLSHLTRISEQERPKASDLVARITDYLKDNNIGNILLLDRAARPAGIALSTSWREKYPYTKRPFDIYFVNPRGFVTQEELAGKDGFLGPSRKSFELFLSRRTGDIYDPSASGRTVDAIKADFETTYPRLADARDEAVLVFDNCIHEGRSMIPIVARLGQFGFTDVRIGVAGNANNRSGLTPDFVAFSDFQGPTCGIFGIDSLVQKPFESVTSVRTSNPADRRKSLQRRAQLGLIKKAPTFAPNRQPEVIVDDGQGPLVVIEAALGTRSKDVVFDGTDLLGDLVRDMLSTMAKVDHSSGFVGRRNVDSENKSASGTAGSERSWHRKWLKRLQDPGNH